LNAPAVVDVLATAALDVVDPEGRVPDDADGDESSSRTASHTPAAATTMVTTTTPAMTPRLRLRSTPGEATRRVGDRHAIAWFGSQVFFSDEWTPRESARRLGVQ
jgi:hypothetical protein